MAIKRTALPFALACALSSPVSGFAQGEHSAEAACQASGRDIVLYSHDVCPDPKFNDQQLRGWDAMIQRLPELLPEAATGKKSAPQMCEHIANLQRLYSEDSENHLLKATTRLEKISRGNEVLTQYLAAYNPYVQDSESSAYIAINAVFLSEDNKPLAALLSYFPEGERGQLLRVRDATLKAKYMTFLYDSVLDVCPDYAKTKGLYKMTYYNGPDARYDPDDDPGWANVPWAKDKE